MPPAIVKDEQLEDTDSNADIESVLNSASSFLKLGITPGGGAPPTGRKKIAAKKTNPHWKGRGGGRNRPFKLLDRKPQRQGHRHWKKGSKLPIILSHIYQWIEFNTCQLLLSGRLSDIRSQLIC